jgi:ABC-type branched-subunit amino acid transport system substrate-binding protein
MRSAHPRLVATGAILALGLAACGGSSSGGKSSSSSSSSSSSTPGVTATSITIGSTQPLTGIAAPGYSEIAPAANAMFQYINHQGGINGRTINYKYLDDAYNPTETVTKTRQLVLNDKVFAIFNGLGTPTHEQVVGYLNSNKIPDLFVASGCLCWDEPQTHPYTFGWQVDYKVEGKILGAYLKKNFAGKKIGVFYQDDDFGQNGLAGLQAELPASQIVAKAPYQVTNTNISSQLTKLAGAKADVVVSFSVPAFTAILKLGMLQANFNPQLVVSNVGSDPITLAGLLSSFSKGKAPGQQLIQGIITDGYLSTPADPTNSWIQLFKKVHDQYDAKAPMDGNVEYGMAVAWTFAEAVAKAGKNLTRQGIVDAIESGLDPGPGLVPFRFGSNSHAGFTGAQIGVITGKAIKLQGTPQTTTDDPSSPVMDYTTPQSTAPANGVPTG